MKSRGCMVFFLLAGILSVTAQTMTTREAKVVAVVNAENNTIKALELFTDENSDKGSLIKKYPDCKFYIGLMEGSYKVVQAIVHPQKGATVNIFYSQPIYAAADMAVMDHYSPGDIMKIGNSEARVISNNKGELIFKTQ
ncbi:MAG: hypothetical protein KJO53_13650 [Eudoraea sp.]|nr:hypothetical protein [Eudoraea sp.]